MTVASRMCRAFARDKGFAHASPYLEQINRTLRVPLWSLVFTSIWVVIFGLICEHASIYILSATAEDRTIDLGSSAALNAILSSSVVFLQTSYMIPSKSLSLLS